MRRKTPGGMVRNHRGSLKSNCAGRIDQETLDEPKRDPDRSKIDLPGISDTMPPGKKIQYTRSYTLDIHKDLHCLGNDGYRHCARLLVRERRKESDRPWEFKTKLTRYLYLAYKDGSRQKEIYISKLESYYEKK